MKYFNPLITSLEEQLLLFEAVGHAGARCGYMYPPGRSGEASRRTAHPPAP